MTVISLKKRKTTKTKPDSHKLSAMKVNSQKDKQTRVEILQAIAENTGLKRVEVEAVFTEMAGIIKSHMKKRGSGEVLVPKLGIKIRRIHRKATKKRTMMSPLTGQEVVIAAKPAREDVKIMALKVLKETVLA
jgi:hypothetical protein